MPRPDLHFTELIKGFWLGSRPPNLADLQPFLTVRKYKVLTAVRYLVQYNPLYEDVTIDHSAIENWPDDFIPSDLQQQVIWSTVATATLSAGPAPTFLPSLTCLTLSKAYLQKSPDQTSLLTFARLRSLKLRDYMNSYECLEALSHL